MTRTQTITFNIGGQRYEISRSLLDQFPETMLTKSASEEWLKDESEEIFIERDGSTFRHVLSYMRDGKVVLPVTEPKKSFVDELTYYGLEMRDEDIDFDRANLRAISSSLEDFKKDLDCDTKGKKLTSFCVLNYFTKTGILHNKLRLRASKTSKAGILIRDITFCDRAIWESNDKKLRIIESANDRLRLVGLKVIGISGGHCFSPAYVQLMRIDPVIASKMKKICLILEYACENRK